MDALWTAGRNTTSDYQVANVALVFEKKYESQIRGLGIEAFADVAILLRSSIAEREDLRRMLERRAGELIHIAATDMPADSARHVAGVLLALASCNLHLDDSRLKEAEALLEDQQNQRDGSWSVLRGQPGTLIATAEVLRATHLLGDRLAERWELGRRWFLETVMKLAEPPIEMETFDLAIALHALADLDEADYGLVLEFEDELTRRQDPDTGGWPSKPKRDGTVEATALAVLALTIAGAHDHVPLNLAQAVLDAARNEVAEISNERDRLRADVEVQVKDEIGHVMAQRKELLAERDRLKTDADQAKELRVQVDRLQRIADPVIYQETIMRPSGLPARTQLIGLMGAAGAIIGVVLGALQLTSDTALSVTVGVALAFAAAAVTFISLRQFELQRQLRVRQLTAERARSQWMTPPRGLGQESLIDSLRTALPDITSNWSAAATNELAYILYDEFGSAPSDVARRRAEQVALRLGAPRETVPQFSSWAAAVGLLDEDERRVLFDQLRRLLLR